MEFIDILAHLIQKYAHNYGIMVNSPAIAQAILESAKGTSELSVNANNFFGLKYTENRCPTCSGIYYKVGSEQNADGTYTSSNMQWCKFENVENGVVGYFDFLKNGWGRYDNLIGVTDPKTYLELIKADGYATSINYVNNLMSVINKYDLTKYDNAKEIEVKNKMRINIHAGHNPDNMVACGAIGLIKESTEARLVKDEVIRQLELLGNTVYDCTVNDGISRSDVLQKIVEKCNKNPVDLDVSIHFNAFDSNANGTETHIYSENSLASVYAVEINDALVDLGFSDRGVKINNSLYVLKNTASPALLVECCFCDSVKDIAIYDFKKVASSIVKGITGRTLNECNADVDISTENKDLLYKVQVGAYSVKENAENMLAKLKELGFEGFIAN